MHTWPNDKQIYGIGASEQKLLVMRPYQIYAVKAIVNSYSNTKATATFGIQQEAEKR
jgi:hypothetical protein